MKEQFGVDVTLQAVEHVRITCRLCYELRYGVQKIDL